MTTQQRLTKERLEMDVERALQRAAGVIGYGHGKGGYAEAVYSQRSTIRDEIVSELRRNWTVTERARSQRTVPGT